jgi:hypothetical protein
MIHQLVEEADFEMGEEAAILFSALDPTGSPPAQPDHICRRKKNVPAARVRASDMRASHGLCISFLHRRGLNQLVQRVQVRTGQVLRSNLKGELSQENDELGLGCCLLSEQLVFAAP